MPGRPLARARRGQPVLAYRLPRALLRGSLSRPARGGVRPLVRASAGSRGSRGPAAIPALPPNRDWRTVRTPRRARLPRWPGQGDLRAGPGDRSGLSIRLLVAPLHEAGTADLQHQASADTYPGNWRTASLAAESSPSEWAAYPRQTESRSAYRAHTHRWPGIARPGCARDDTVRPTMDETVAVSRPVAPPRPAS